LYDRTSPEGGLHTGQGCSARWKIAPNSWMLLGFARAGLPSWQLDANVAARWFKRVCRSLCARTGPGHGGPSIAASVRSHQRRSAGRGPLPSPRALCPTGSNTSSRCSRVKVDVAGARIGPAPAFPRAYPPHVQPGWIPHTLSHPLLLARPALPSPVGLCPCAQALARLRAGERTSKSSSVAATAVASVFTATAVVVAASATASEPVRAAGEGGGWQGERQGYGPSGAEFRTVSSLA